MFSSKQTFQSVATTEHEDSVSGSSVFITPTPDPPRKRQWRSALTRTPVILALAVFLLGLIAALQVAVSLSTDFERDQPDAGGGLKRRQTTISTKAYSARTNTISAHTWTRNLFTITYLSPPGTSTYLASTITDPADAITFDATTITEGQALLTAEDGISTQYFKVYVENEVTLTSYSTPIQASTVTSAMYLDTSSPSSNSDPQASTGAPVSQSYLQESQASSVPAILTAPSATTSAVYLLPQATSVQTPLSDNTDESAAPATSLLPPVPQPTAQIPSAPTSSLTVVTSAYLYTSTTSKSATPSHFAFNSPDVSRVVKGQYTTERYYVATYLPSILIIVVKAVWSSIFSAIKLIEPIIRLCSPSGATVSTSLLAEYLSSTLSFSFLLGLRTPGIMVATGIAALTTMLAPIAASSMAIHGTAKCTTDGFTRMCVPVWTLDMLFVRLIQGLLALVVFLLFLYILLTWHDHHSGLGSDPSSIASISQMTSNPELIAEIRSLPPSANNATIRKLLSGNRYGLGTFNTSPYTSAFGIIKINNHHNPYSTLVAPPPSSSSHKTRFRKPYRRSLLLHDIPLLLLIATLLALILAYWFDGASDPLNNFFSNNTFTPRFLLSALATIADNRFKRLEREVRVLQPWRMILRTRSTATAGTEKYEQQQDDDSRAKTQAMTRGLPGTCYTSALISLQRKQWTVAVVSITAVLGDLLIIAVVGVPYSDAEIYEAFRVSLWLSVGILVLMGSTVLFVVLWWRKTLLDAVTGGGRMPESIMGVARVLLRKDIAQEDGQRVGLLPGRYEQRHYG